MPGMGFGSMSYPPVRGAHPPDLLRIRPLESRMLGNLHVRFGGGRMEKGVMTYLASRLPDRRVLRCRRTDARNAAVGSDDKVTSSTAVEASCPLKAILRAQSP